MRMIVVKLDLMLIRGIGNVEQTPNPRDLEADNHKGSSCDFGKDACVYS